MATHSSVLVWRIPGTAEPGGLPSVGSHRVGHDRSDLAAAAASQAIRVMLRNWFFLWVCLLLPSHRFHIDLVQQSSPPAHPTPHGTKFWARKNDSTKIIIWAQEGKVTTFPVGLHVQLSRIFLESDVNRVTSKPITKFFFSFFFKNFSVSSVSQSCPTLCDPMNRSTPGLPVRRKLPVFTQTQVHRVSDAIQPSHPLSSPSPPALNPSQHQSLFQWVSSSHEVAKVLEFQL